jgi:hypothetical protein
LKKAFIGSSLIKTMYAGAFVYEDSDGDGTDDLDLQYVLNPEGKIDVETSSTYLYDIKDHLGNTRVTFNDIGTLLQTENYYPFGMRFNQSQGGENKYLYNGKEIQDEQLGGVNLDWYDYIGKFYKSTLMCSLPPKPVSMIRLSVEILTSLEALSILEM